MDTEKKYQEAYALIQAKLKEIEHNWGARNQLAQKSGVKANLIFQIINKPSYKPSFRTVYKILYALTDRCPLNLNGNGDKYRSLLDKLKNITNNEADN